MTGMSEYHVQKPVGILRWKRIYSISKWKLTCYNYKSLFISSVFPIYRKLVDRWYPLSYVFLGWMKILFFSDRAYPLHCHPFIPRTARIKETLGMSHYSLSDSNYSVHPQTGLLDRFRIK